MPSDIKFNCAGCGTHIVIDEAGAGMSVPCPNCGASLNVPKIDSFCARGLLPGVLREGETITPQGIVHKFVMNRDCKIAGCSQNILDRIQDSLLEGIQKGETMRELTKRVQKEFRGVDKDRAYTIAQTLSQAAYSADHFKGLKDAGYRTKRWVTSDDELVSESHRACERQRAIPMDEPFVNGLMYPGDPKGDAGECEGCRCILEVGGSASEEAERMNLEEDLSGIKLDIKPEDIIR
jgi:SPP1 gp7 family putative phage head morphogenesis protein